ncbi:MAG: exosortase system-associated protein, TIGR04073 family [Mariprofundus sp.]|nr:exosortase system-associated protein, TIGR04073 family [Mariprofundus sp.]
MQFNKQSKYVFMAAVAAAVFTITPVMAGEYADDAGSKFTRGLANTVTGWGEIPKNIANESRSSNVLVGFTWGAVKGVAHAIGRSSVGVFDLATFFAPSAEYVHSTYVWNDARRDTTYGAY